MLRQVLLLLSAALLASLTTVAARANFSDDAIEAAIQRRLDRDPAIFNYDITVVSQDGTVTLAGTVRNLLEKDRTAKIASSRKGVRTVINQLTVAAGPRSADEIKADVESALANTPALAQQKIAVAVENGTVILSGETKLYDLIGLAGNVASGIYGVRGLANRLTLGQSPVGARSDAEIRSHINRRFQMDVWLSDLLIDPSVEKGAVTLAGEVAGQDQLARAIAAAWVSGVHSVEASQLTVNDSLDDGSRRDPEAGRTVSDADILAAIEDGLKRHSWINSENIEVESKNRAVVLRGKVPYIPAKTAAFRLAANTTGVKHVSNQLIVEPDLKVTDAKLVSAVSDALAADAYTHGLRIEPSAEDGKIVLSGMVPSTFERNRAAETAAGIYGVRAIGNQIRVDRIRRGYHPSSLDEIMEPFPPTRDVVDKLKSDVEIQTAIEDELRWSWFLDGSGIKVSVKAGVAKLEGSVKSERALKAALHAAADGGAGAIVNELSIARAID